MALNFLMTFMLFSMAFFTRFCSSSDSRHFSFCADSFMSFLARMKDCALLGLLGWLRLFWVWNCGKGLGWNWLVGSCWAEENWL